MKRTAIALSLALLIVLAGSLSAVNARESLQTIQSGEPQFRPSVEDFLKARSPSERQYLVKVLKDLSPADQDLIIEAVNEAVKKGAVPANNAPVPAVAQATPVQAPATTGSRLVIGRYQLVSGTASFVAINGATAPYPTMFKIDTATGETWMYSFGVQSGGKPFREWMPIADYK
jgi:hypothetical protein